MTRTEKYKDLRKSMEVDIDTCIDLIVFNYRKEYPNRDIKDLKELCSKIIDEKDNEYAKRTNI